MENGDELGDDGIVGKVGWILTGELRSFLLAHGGKLVRGLARLFSRSAGVI